MPDVFIPPSECPVCGEDVPRGARACPGCGADERSGWNEEATRYDGLNLPAEAFGNDSPPPTRPSASPFRTGALLVTIAAVVLAFVFF